MNNIVFYNGNDQLEDSMLRSILLFNENKTVNSSKDLLLKAIFSIVTFGNGKYGITEINKILGHRFGVNFTDEDLNKQIDKLKEKKLVTILDSGKFQAITNEEKSKSFFNNIELETLALIDGIIDRIKKHSHIQITQNDIIKAKNNIGQALSIYYKMYGYSFFGLKEEAGVKDIKDAVDTARNGLPDILGKALVGALADVIDKPSQREKDILEKWARAFVAMEVINLDPSLRNFKATKLRGKSFVIDTDVVLYTLTTHAKYSRAYRNLIELLKKNGCILYIPLIVIEEVVNHINAAIKRYSYNGSQWSSMTDEILEKKMANVFVEDYTKIIRDNEKRKDIPFDVYIDNLYDVENPSLLMDKLKSIFGNFQLLEDLEALDDEIKKKLASNIKYITQISAKGIRRDEEKNTKIAEADASLYLTIRKMNQDESGNNKPLNQKAYLLTKSQKTITCAQELNIYDKNIICDPFALLSILQEMGMFEGYEVEFVNLFENPFLTYTANLIWDEVEPLLNNGVRLKYVEIHKLRLDVDVNIDKILTCETVEERITEAKRLNDRGYFFANDLLAAEEELGKKNKDIQERENIISTQAEEIKRLKDLLESATKENRKKKYLERLDKKKK